MPETITISHNYANTGFHTWSVVITGDGVYAELDGFLGYGPALKAADAVMTALFKVA